MREARPGGCAPRHRGRNLLLAPAVVLCAVAAGFPGTAAAAPPLRTAGTGVPVTPCRAPLPSVAGIHVPAVPHTVVLPRGVSLPPGVVVYGTGEPGSSFVAFSVGPASYRCSALAGGDGSFVISLIGPGARLPAMNYDYSPGGAGIALDLACPYIPEVRAADAAFRGGAVHCTHPGTDVVTQVPTGATGLWAATVQVPPGTRDRNFELGRQQDQDIAIFVATRGGGQSADCALPPGQRAICAAGLRYFVAQSVAVHSGPGTVAAIQAAIGKAEPAPQTECPAALDVSLDQEIDKSAGERIPIPRATMDLPAGLSGKVDVSFVPGEATVCQSGVATHLTTPDGFDGGHLSLEAAITGQASRGPFTYSADSTAWTSVPGAPPGQQLMTHFDPASASASVDPRLSAEFSVSGGPPEIGVTIAQVTLSALHQEVTLMAPPGPLLRVGLGPSLELEVLVSKRAADTAVEDEETQGVAEASAEQDVADQLSGDAVVAVDETASEFYGVDITSQVSQQLFGSLQDGLAGALQADPAVAAFDAVAAPAVASEVTAADAVAIDAELASESAVEVDGLDLLLLLFL